MARLLIPIASLALVLTGFIAVGAHSLFGPRSRAKHAADPTHHAGRRPSRIRRAIWLTKLTKTARTALHVSVNFAKRAGARLLPRIEAGAEAAGRLGMCCLSHCSGLRTVPVILGRSVSRTLCAVINVIQAHRRHKPEQTQQPTAIADTRDIDSLNCRARLGSAQTHGSDRKAFLIDLCGSIPSDAPSCPAVVHVEVADITDGSRKPQPVTAADDYGAIRELSAYSYSADIGTLSERITTLHDWTVVARVPVDQLVFPRRGKRTLLFHVSVRAKDSAQDLAAAQCNIQYENTDFGYIDHQDNVRRARDLAVAVAFSLAAADGKLFACEVEIIKKWTRSNILSAHPSTGDGRRLEKALDRTVSFFRNGGRLDVPQMCGELVRIVPVGQRHSILDLCLNVVRAKGHASADELQLLKQLAAWLDIDQDKYRSMMEKTLPIDMHGIRDMETILGITADMTQDEARRQLNKEYAKWNARVTSADPTVRDQADQMLQLIAQARSKYVGVVA